MRDEQVRKCEARIATEGCRHGIENWLSFGAQLELPDRNVFSIVPRGRRTRSTNLQMPFLRYRRF